MNNLSDIVKLTKDREKILKILEAFNIDILKLEKKSANNDKALMIDYIIWLGGINKLLYQKNKIEIENALNESFLNRNIIFTFR